MADPIETDLCCRCGMEAEQPEKFTFSVLDWIVNGPLCDCCRRQQEKGREIFFGRMKIRVRELAGVSNPP